MLDGAVNILDYVMEDYMVLGNYIKGFENSTILLQQRNMMDLLLIMKILMAVSVLLEIRRKNIRLI